MKLTQDKRTIISRDNDAPGFGQITIEHLLEPPVRPANTPMFARVTIDVNSKLGDHPHNGETETYYILDGEGVYTDNGKTYPVSAGDVTFCEDGGTHALENIGDTPLIFVAMIVKA